MLKRKSILVVDDEPNVRNILEELFLKMGFNVIQAEDNASAIRIISERSLSLITTDMIRPYASGLDLIREVRKMSKGSSVPIIMITGQYGPEYELAAWRSGISAFLHKPFGIIEIINTIDKILEQATEDDIRLLNLKVEGRDLDYKEIIDFETNTSRAELARDIIGMANSGGGLIIIGVSERDGSFTHQGLSSSDLYRYETTRLNDSIKKYVASTAFVSSKVVEYKRKSFVFITVHAAIDTIALAAIPNENAGLYQGRIYIRTQAGNTTELTDPLELRRLIDRLVDKRMNVLLRKKDG